MKNEKKKDDSRISGEWKGQFRVDEYSALN